MSKQDVADVWKELEDTKKELDDLKVETSSLRKAVWDMLNYAQMYVVILDKDMNVVLMNYSLAIALGFKDEKEPIGRCWADFIPVEGKDLVYVVHNKLAFEQDLAYREVMNEIQTLSGDKLLIKWFNIPINSNFNMTFSIGLPKLAEPIHVSEEAVRAYYADILERDKTMIKSIKDSITGLQYNSDSCILKE